VHRELSVAVKRKICANCFAIDAPVARILNIRARRIGVKEGTRRFMKQGRILAVDDDPIVLDTYRVVLEDFYDLHLASSAEDALHFLQCQRPVDVILLDVLMPITDGYEACRRIRLNPRHIDSKIIFVSSKIRIEERLQGYDLGADDYLTKPFEGSELLAKIKVFMRLKNVEEIDKIKTDFINLLYHETRTPLTGILGYAALLRQSPQLTLQEQSFVEQIQRSGELILRSCEKTMLLSDLKSGNIVIKRARIPVSIVLTNQQQQQLSAAKREIRIRGDADIWIHADPKLFGLVMDILLENAIKFSPEGTAVEVTVKSLHDQVRIEVANEGEPITREQQKAIFSEFVVPDVSHHHKGQGLNLAIARRIVEAHDGTLTISNRACGPVFAIEMTPRPGSSPGS
jgi:two-component system sensor histidine kinase/response regulator